MSPLLCFGVEGFLGRGPQFVKRVMILTMIRRQNKFQTSNKRITVPRHFCTLHCTLLLKDDGRWILKDVIDGGFIHEDYMHTNDS